MNIEKEHLLLSAACSSREIFAMVQPILKPSFFAPELRAGVKFIKNYYQDYKNIPSTDIIKAECSVSFDYIENITKDQIEYVCAELDSHCRNKAVEESIRSSIELLAKEDYGTIIENMKNAINLGVKRDLGIDFFKDPKSLLKQTVVDKPRIPTLWSSLDCLLSGGVDRQEMIIFSANSGVGKSNAMMNLCCNLLKQNLSGIYISLEMDAYKVAKRVATMITGDSQVDLLLKHEETASKIEEMANTCGKFFIKRMPEGGRTNISHITAYIQQLELEHGFKPDFICVDYLDILGTLREVSAANMFLKDQVASEELRSLGFDFNAVIITASQLGKHAQEAEKLTQAHIQGGSSKTNTTDILIAIRQDEVMKETGEMWFDILKSRISEHSGKSVLMCWDSKCMQIRDVPKKGPQKVQRQRFVSDDAKYGVGSKSVMSNPLDKLLN